MEFKKTIFYAGLIALISYFFINNSVDFSQLAFIQWTGKAIIGLLGAVSMMLVRDIGYVLRVKHLSAQKLRWAQSIKIVLLWEFGSAITPGMLGGKAVALFLLVKNGIQAAHASAIVLMAILLDELVFILVFPILYFFLGNKLFQVHTSCPDWVILQQKFNFLQNVVYIKEAFFWMLGVILLFVIVVCLGVFIRPTWVENLTNKLASFRILRRWESNFITFGRETLDTHEHFKNQKPIFWAKLVFYTLLTWLGRYAVAVTVVWGFSNWDSLPLFQIYAQQYSLWFMFYLPTTPGSSGLAEAIFMAYYCVYLPIGQSGLIAFLWRCLSYYVYVIIGLFAIFVSLLFHKNKLK